MLGAVNRPDPAPGPATAPARRRPHRVYDVGSDPDIRDSLANERTFLAWVRTSLALVAGAVAVSSPALEFSMTARLVLAIGLLAVGAAGIGVGWHRWMRTEIAMRTAAQPPGFTGGLLFLVAIGGLLSAALIISIVGHR